MANPTETTVHLYTSRINSRSNAVHAHSDLHTDPAPLIEDGNRSITNEGSMFFDGSYEIYELLLSLTAEQAEYFSKNGIFPPSVYSALSLQDYVKSVFCTSESL